MGAVSIKKIESLLDFYRAKLEMANRQPIEHVEGIRLTAKIGLLEDLYVYALQDNPAPVSETSAEV